MSGVEWVIVGLMVAIATIVMLSGGLPGSKLGALLSGEALPPMTSATGPGAIVAALATLSLLLLFASRRFPDQSGFLRTGAIVLLGGGLLYGLLGG